MKEASEEWQNIEMIRWVALVRRGCANRATIQNCCDLYSGSTVAALENTIRAVGMPAPIRRDQGNTFNSVGWTRRLVLACARDELPGARAIGDVNR